MKKCEFCGKRFDPEIEREDFEYSSIFAYDNFKGDICADCAARIIDDKIEGYYFETCEKCGKEFDYFADAAEYDSHFSGCNGTTLHNEWDDCILCADCAIEKVDSEAPFFDDEDCDGDIPECCKECGGPYPSCRLGCNILDD